MKKILKMSAALVVACYVGAVANGYHINKQIMDLAKEMEAEN